jgi:hypothetical protein
LEHERRPPVRKNCQQKSVSKQESAFILAQTFVQKPGFSEIPGFLFAFHPCENELTIMSEPTLGQFLCHRWGELEN